MTLTFPRFCIDWRRDVSNNLTDKWISRHCFGSAALQVVEKTETGGRKVTREGQQDLDRIAGQVNRGDE